MASASLVPRPILFHCVLIRVSLSSSLGNATHATLLLQCDHYGIYMYSSCTGENLWILLYYNTVLEQVDTAMFCAHAEASRYAACDVACLVYKLEVHIILVHIILKEVMHWQ